jgi:FAD/FMN-containing dehydrogenase
MNVAAPLESTLVAQLREVVGADGVVTGLTEREAYSADAYAAGATCAFVLRPKTPEQLAQAVGIVTRAGYDVCARGGGMSYTGGYTPIRTQSAVVDMGGLNRIVEIAPDDMYITVEAGVSWKQIYAALQPLGLRLPFFGTWSGARATVGGGLSNGALFFGTARYGTAADNVFGLDVALADGTILRTGQGAFRNVRKPAYRTYGPDLTGLFLHDTGALGVKVRATLRLIRAPAESGYASFVFPTIDAVALALSDVARADVTEEAYVFDPESTRKNLATSAGVLQDAKTLLGVIKGQSNWLKGLKEGAQLVASGRDFVPAEAYSLHVVCAGRSAAAVESDLVVCRELAAKRGGAEIVNSIPKAARGGLFPPLNGILGPSGDRWAALNAKVAHTEALRLVHAAERIVAAHAADMAAAGVSFSRLLIAVSNHAFSYEPVFHWHDTWLPVHRRTPEAGYLANLAEPRANPAAAALVAKLRHEMVACFAAHGAASNQIGKTYAYFESLAPATRELLEQLKRDLDPHGRMNPGALGLRAPAGNS